MDKNNIFIALGTALIAVFGSCVKWLNFANSEHRKVMAFVSETVSAAFTGFLVYCLYKWLNINIYISFALAGIIGYQGTKGVDQLAKIIMKKAGFDSDEKKDEKKG